MTSEQTGRRAAGGGDAAVAAGRPEITGPGGAADTARPPIVYVYLAIIVASWALNWPLMKIALAGVPPFVFVLLRLVGSLAALVPALAASGQPVMPRPGERLGLLWVGLLQVAGFLACGIVGLQILPPGRAIVLAYTMPLWAIPIGLFLWPEPFGRKEIAGAAIGFAGLVLFMNPGLVDWRDPRVLAGNFFLLLAAIAWALGSCLYRRRSWRSPFWTQTVWQIAVSIVPVAALAVATARGAAVHWSLGIVAIVAYNAVVTTALGYFLWNKVLSMMPAATAGQVMTLTPIGGFVLSLWLFGGAAGADVIVSIALIVAGIMVTLAR